MYCIITGGNVVNKGAQSMTMITINEIKKRYPDDEIILALPDEFNADMYTAYQMIPCLFRTKTIFYLLGGAARAIALSRKVDRQEIDRIDSILKNTRCMIDISGYALGSNWGNYIVRFYLCMIHLASKYNVPVYVMPQSFGPFKYPFPRSIVYKQYIGYVMQKPRVVYAREQEGFELMKNTFHLNNLRLSRDMVLLSEKVETERVFSGNYTLSIPDIDYDSVAIIPNVRLLDAVPKERLLDLYTSIAQKIVELRKKIVLLYHSGEDRDFAFELSKSLTSSGIDHSILDQDLNCIEFEEAAKRFDIIVASRYHSLVHAFKAGTPCIAIGWAVKYQELFNALNQSQYCFDVKTASADEITQAIEQIMRYKQKQREDIKDAMNHLQKEENLFSVINEK